MYYHAHMTMTAGEWSELAGNYGGTRLDGTLDGHPVSYTLSPGEQARITFDAVEMPIWGKGKYGFEYVLTYLDKDGQPLMVDGHTVGHSQVITVPPDLIAGAHAIDMSGKGWLYES